MSTTVKHDGILLKSGTNEVEFIEFYIAGISYGINVSKVTKVIELSSTKVTPLVQAPPAVRGTFHLNDKPVAVIDLREALAIDPADSGASERQLLLVTSFNKVTTGYVIDGIHKIHRTSWSQFQPMSESISDGVDAGYTTGTIEIEDRIVLVLDLERLMLDYYPDQVAPPVHERSADEKIREARARTRVVYCEDSRMIRRKTVECLKHAGFEQIAVFENGQDGLDYLAEERRKAETSGGSLREAVDIVVTDIEMPRLDGLTLCHEVKRHGTDGHSIPAVVVYSSLINREMAEKCRSVGADAQLSKPHGDEIVVLIDQLCGFASQPTDAASPA